MSDLEIIAEIGGLDDGSELRILAIYIMALLSRVRFLEEKLTRFGDK